MAISILVVDDSQVERVLVEGLLCANPEYQVRLAENGREALEMMASNPPDLVVTDLVMSEMDGLELVRTMRNRYPTIPAILMTALGDESTAVDALEAGAASYVPKAQKAERLLSAVERVADCAEANRSSERLAQCALEYHCRFALDNDRRLIRTFVAQVQQTMTGLGFDDTVERVRVGEALEEALLNAMYHGNLEVSSEELAKVRAEVDDHLLDRLVEERCRNPQMRQRRILVVVHITESEARFVIRDEGHGFNHVYGADAPTTECFSTGKSRGMTLIHSLMDEVTFNQAGNELVMRKRVPGKGTSRRTRGAPR